MNEYHTRSDLRSWRCADHVGFWRTMCGRTGADSAVDTNCRRAVVSAVRFRLHYVQQSLAVRESMPHDMTIAPASILAPSVSKDNIAYLIPLATETSGQWMLSAKERLVNRTGLPYASSNAASARFGTRNPVPCSENAP